MAKGIYYLRFILRGILKIEMLGHLFSLIISRPECIIDNFAIHTAFYRQEGKLLAKSSKTGSNVFIYHLKGIKFTCKTPT